MPDGNGKYPQIRIKVVRPHWDWNSEGYLGGEGVKSVELWDNPTRGDMTTQTFRSEPFLLPSGVSFSDIQARVWFCTDYSHSDDGIRSGFPGTAPGDMEAGTVVLTPLSGEVTIDCFLGNIFYLKLTCDVTIKELKNPLHARPIVLIVEQDAVGGHLLYFDDSFNVGEDVPDLAISSGANVRDYFGFIHNKTSELTDVVAFVRGYEPAET